jgi:hypothetical protein
MGHDEEVVHKNQDMTSKEKLLKEKPAITFVVPATFSSDEDRKKQDMMVKEKPSKEQPAIAIVDPVPVTANFFSRFASIPIIQDSFYGAHNMVRQHTVGQKALDYAETKLRDMMTSAQPYLPSDDNKVLFRANSIGNKSLDIIERQFPMISAPTDQLVEPIKGRIETAVSHFRERKSTVVNPRLDFIADQFESLIDQYLPSEEEEKQQPREQTSEDHGMNRLLKAINILSTRASKKISQKVSATVEEERQIKQMLRTWVLDQANVMIQQKQQQWPLLQEQMESFKTKFGPTVQVMYNFTQTEFDKFRQELFKPNISHMDRIRNILVLSQTDLLKPLYERSYSIWSRTTPVTTEN